MANQRVNMNSIMQDIQDPKNWKETHKKAYSVYACVPELGTKVTNSLEGSDYVTNVNTPIVLSGTVGEQWAVDIGKLCKTYTFGGDTPTEISPESLYKKFKRGNSDPTIEDGWIKVPTKSDATVNFAFFLPKEIQNFEVKTAWGATLYANRPEVKHGKGDFLVCSSVNGQPNLNDVWIVNGEIFPSTYSLDRFKGMFDTKARGTEKPTANFSILGPEDLLYVCALSHSVQLVKPMIDAFKKDGKLYGSKVITSKDDFKKSNNISFLVSNSEDNSVTSTITVVGAGKFRAEVKMVVGINSYKSKSYGLMHPDLCSSEEPSDAAVKFLNREIMYHLNDPAAQLQAQAPGSAKPIINKLVENLKASDIHVESVVHDIDALKTPEELASETGISVDGTTGKVDVWDINFTKDEMTRATVIVDKNGQGNLWIGMVVNGDDTGLFNNLSQAQALNLLRMQVERGKDHAIEKEEGGEVSEAEGYKASKIVKAIVDKASDRFIPIIGSPLHETKTNEDIDNGDFDDCDVWTIYHTTDKSVYTTILVEDRGCSSHVQIAFGYADEWLDPELVSSVADALRKISNNLDTAGVRSTFSDASKGEYFHTVQQIQENWKNNANTMNQAQRKLKSLGINVDMHHKSKNEFRPDNPDLSGTDVWTIEASNNGNNRVSFEVRFGTTMPKTADDVVKEIRSALEKNGISTKANTKSLVSNWFSRK